MNRPAPLNALLKLPPRARAAAASELIASLDGEPDENVEREWTREIRRRAREIDAGKASLVSWRTLRARLRSKYGA